MDFKIEEEIGVVTGSYSDNENEVVVDEATLAIINLGDKVYAKIGNNFYNSVTLRHIARLVDAGDAAMATYKNMTQEK